MSAIWQQLSAVEMDPGKVSDLPEDAGSLLSHNASQLLVRDVYHKFWVLIKDELPGDSSSL